MQKSMKYRQDYYYSKAGNLQTTVRSHTECYKNTLLHVRNEGLHILGIK